MQSLSVMDVKAQGFWENRRTNRRLVSDVTGRTRENIETKVLDPMTVVNKEKAVYTDYRIETKASGLSTLALSWSSVRRRYSEFVWLDRKLKKQVQSSIRPLPVLPEKKLLGRFAADFILRRQRGLQQYLQCLFQHEELLSNPYLHLFLQTKFTPSEIETTLQRKDPADVNHIIILATANQRQESYWKTTTRAFDNSLSSLATNDVLGSSGSSSSGYYGDEEVPDQLLESFVSSHTFFDLQGMVGNDHFSSSSQESTGASFEDFFEFDDLTKRRRSVRSVDLPCKGRESLVEYVMPMSSYDGDSYIVYAKQDKQPRETSEQRIKRIVNEYQVISLL